MQEGLVVEPIDELLEVVRIGFLGCRFISLARNLALHTFSVNLIQSATSFQIEFFSGRCGWR
jgi:hypothetical protein